MARSMLAQDSQGDQHPLWQRVCQVWKRPSIGQGVGYKDYCDPRLSLQERLLLAPFWLLQQRKVLVRRS